MLYITVFKRCLQILLREYPFFLKNLNLDKNVCSTEINYWLKEKRAKKSSKAKKSNTKKFGKDEKSYITNVEI